MGSIDRFKRGDFYSKRFVAGTISGDTNWNGYENNLFFERVGERRFTDVARARGCDVIEDSRGVAIADINQDGVLDVLINNNNAPPTLLLNQMPSVGNHLSIKLIGGEKTNRDAIGARVSVNFSFQGKPKRVTRWVEAGTGYAAQSAKTLHFGVGDATEIESLSIRWPDGELQSFSKGQLDGIVNGFWILSQSEEKFVAMRAGLSMTANQ